MSELMAREDLNALPDEVFRQRLRDWLAANYPAQWRQDAHRPFRRLRNEDTVAWFKLLYQGGWRAAAWPREHGGLALSFSKQLIYHEEMEHVGAARVIDFGEHQLGPTLINCGTPEQKAYYLPRILKGQDVWCQGYSEPGAGSDLASLRTAALLDGDYFVVNGQKIWTTHANDATHIFALVRTGKYPKRQQGISFLLIDLKTPGISIRPIVNVAGEDEFCEVFFDNVRVPASQLVGALDEGWAVAKALLGYERIWVGSPAMASTALALAQSLFKALKLQNDQGISDRLAQLTVDLHDYRHLYAEMCDAVADGRQPGADVSLLKVYVSELLQRITEFNYEIAAEYGGIVGDVRIGQLKTDLHWQFMMSRPPTIYGGANEIQRDILAKAVLGLPAEPAKA